MTKQRDNRNFDNRNCIPGNRAIFLFYSDSEQPNNPVGKSLLRDPTETSKLFIMQVGRSNAGNHALEAGLDTTDAAGVPNTMGTIVGADGVQQL